MQTTQIKIGSLAVFLGIVSSLQAQTPIKPKVNPNLPDPLFDISQAEAAENQHYNQPNRPQFHYTPVQGFVGDATGLIYYSGTYHLFYMSDKWERRKNRNKRWGYATSKDLLHWEEQPSVLDPIQDHKPGSGSGIVDWDNTLGLATGKEKTLMVYYTDYQTGSCILYSLDAGKTWIRHPRNPILSRVGSDDRDPMVFWYGPAKEWRMIRHWEPFDDGSEGKTGFAFFSSTNLLDWTYLSKIGDFNECPDFFELPVNGGRPGEKKWVLLDAGFNYKLGSFDGKQFVPETDKLRADYGGSEFAYAPQTWKKTRDGSGAPIQMGFLHYPKGASEMPVRLTWHGQMTFPCELRLRQFPEGARICREPIKEIESLYTERKTQRDLTVKPGENPLADLKGDVFDIQAEIDLGTASTISLGIRGQVLRYSVAEQKLEMEPTKVTLRLNGKPLRLRVLVDRASIEAFADEGEVSMSRAFFFDPAQTDFSLTTDKGDIRVKSLVVNRLKSIWPEKALSVSHKQ